MKKLEALPVGALQPGMQVAAQVLDDAGRILLPEGAQLSESTIASLERRGVEQVTVEIEVEEDPAEVEHYRRQVKSRLDQLFRRAGEAGETAALYEAVLNYRMGQRP